MIVIPTHACSADDGRLPASDVYGELGADNVATCALRVRWGFHRGQDERVAGCGARISVCHGCGLRTRVNGARCEACGGEERPVVSDAVDVARATSAPVQAVDGGPAMAAAVAPLASGGHGGARDVGRAEVGTRRPAEAKAPSKPRAPQKRVRKVAEEGPTLPGLK